MRYRRDYKRDCRPSKLAIRNIEVDNSPKWYAYLFQELLNKIEERKVKKRLFFIDDERDHGSSFTSVKYREKLGLRYFTPAELEILRMCPHVDVARNYDQAISFLQANQMDVAKWIVNNLKYKFEFYVYSANPK